jgi:hypothetical protein
VTAWRSSANLASPNAGIGKFVEAQGWPFK